VAREDREDSRQRGGIALHVRTRGGALRNVVPGKERRVLALWEENPDCLDTNPYGPALVAGGLVGSTTKLCRGGALATPSRGTGCQRSLLLSNFPKLGMIG
jgi:hypothetical protein